MVPIIKLQEGVNIQPRLGGDEAAVHPPLDPAGRHGRVLPGGAGAGEHGLPQLQRASVQHHGRLTVLAIPAQRIIQPPVAVADIRLPVRPHLSEHQRDGLRPEHEAHQWTKDLVSHVGVQTPGCGDIHGTGERSSQQQGEQQMKRYISIAR